MTDRMRKAIDEYLEAHNEEALDLARQFNQIDGSFDWVEAYDFEELCKIAAEGGAEEVERLCWVCVNGETCGGRVRYDAYSNLEPAEEDDLLCDADDSRSDIINVLDDYIDDDGSLSRYIKLSDDLQEVCNNANLVKLHITNIDYDIDSDDLEDYNGDKGAYIADNDLPIELTLEYYLSSDSENVEDDIDLDEVADMISDETGYCIYSYHLEIAEED